MPKPETKPAEQEAAAEALKRIGDCIRRRGSVLDLSRLHLTQLPPKILQIQGLRELDISHNRLGCLPPEVLQFSGLTRLDLSNNPIAELPPEIGRLAGLTRLDLTHSHVRSLPAEIGRLTGLTRLYLDHNPLETLPPEIALLANLTRIYLSHNKFTGFPPALAGLDKLTRLDLSHNRLQSLPPEIASLANLTVLELSGNPLENLPPEIASLARLTVLKLADTRLTSLPPAIGSLGKLAELDLADNPLATLPDSLVELENLDRLFLHENPALQLSPSILGPDPRKTPDSKHAAAKSILAFYFGRKSGSTRPLNEVKLVLLGREGAGKTSIVQALRDLPFREGETRTAGVARCNWTMDGSGGPAVTARVWDLSGHPATHILHPFFFSPRNLFILVLTGKDHHEREDAEYWLHLIQAHASDGQGQGPPVIIALNQWNVPGSRPEVDRIALRERFPFIRGFVEMDCKAKKGVPALKTALFRELERMPWVREPFPEPWDQVRRALAGTTTLTASAYRDLCAEHGVEDPGQQDYLLDCLHHLGVVLTRHGDPAVMNPEWLAAPLYQLLHRARLRAGILTRADVDLALTTEKDEATRTRLMDTLESFGLAIAGHPASGTVWILPHAQPASPPAARGEFPDDADAIRFRTVSGILHDGLLARITARRFDFIEESRDIKLQWRHGLILARKGARALFESDPERHPLTVTVTGPVKPRNELADLCQAEIRDLLDDVEFTSDP